jgi:restriction system protein
MNGAVAAGRFNPSGRNLNFADAAVQVLLVHGGGPLHYRDITEKARASGLIHPRSDTPWTYMSSAILHDIRRRKRRGEASRLAPAGRGYYRLQQPSGIAEEAILSWNADAKRRLREKLRDLDPYAFEGLIADLLERAGFEEIEPTKRSADGGIDVRAVLTVGGLARVITAIQVKRWRRNVPIETVRELRGSLNADEQGLIVTLSDFTRDALVEATAAGRAPIGLLGGEALVDLLAEHGLGFVRQEIVLLNPDEELFSGRIEPSPAAEPSGTSGTSGADLITATTVGARYGIFKVPGGRPRLQALELMLFAVSGQPVLDYVNAFSSTFPKITRVDMAERYMRVLVALGLCEIVEEHLHRTADGADYLVNDEAARRELLRQAFAQRLYGGAELLEELASGPATEGALFEVLQRRGLDRLTRTQLSYLLDWHRFLTGASQTPR